MFLHWAFLVSRFNAKYFSQNLLLTLMFLHWAILVSRFNAKYSSKIFNIFFEHLQNIFSKFASHINIFPLGFSRVRVQCKVFFRDPFQKEENRGTMYFWIIFQKPEADIKSVLKVNQLYLQILRRQCCLK